MHTGIDSSPNISFYNYKIPVRYSNTTEYRNCFRQVFFIDIDQILVEMKIKYQNFDTFDSETKDELLFDESKVDKVMGDILIMTMFAEPFRELYKIAAGFVISEVFDIGLAILMSYDYFQEFHLVLCEWFEWCEANKMIESIQSCPERCPSHISSSDLSRFFENSIPMKNLREKLVRVRTRAHP
jgi:hypothetical protein